MIYESIYWKQPLIDSADWLVRLRLKDNSRESTHVKLEKEVFIGFYAIRKLIEARKLTTSLVQSKFDVSSFQNIKPVHHFNWHHIYDCYEFENPGCEIRDLEFICNLFIHSFVFILNVTEKGKIVGFYVTTSKKKAANLYFIHRDVVVAIFRKVGRDDVVVLEAEKDSETGDIEFHAT